MAEIIFNEVTVSYGESPVLKDLTFVVEKEDFVIIMGPNGTGKTTLVKTLLGVKKPDKGLVYVLGCPVQKVCPHRKKIGYVPQFQSIDPDFPATLYDVVLTGSYANLGYVKLPGKEEKEEALRLIEEVGLKGMENHPFGRLSGGQQRRGLIARALMGSPRILVLDEPTAGVDLASQNQVRSTIQEIYKRTRIPVLLVTHDINPFLSLVTKIVLLGYGKHFVGGKEDIIREEILREVYGEYVRVIEVAGKKYVMTRDYHYA